MIQKPEGFGEIFIKEYLETHDKFDVIIIFNDIMVTSRLL